MIGFICGASDTIIGQTENVTHINFPSDKLGLMPEDMVYAGGKLFLYSSKGIAVYLNGNYETTIILDGQPVSRAFVEVSTLVQTRTTYNTMAFDGLNTIYAVGPDYSVWSIDINTYAMDKVIQPCFNNVFFNGSIKLIYEPNSKWLFYAAQGPINWAADALPQFFGIYDTDVQNQYMQQIFSFIEPPNVFPDIYDILIEYKTDEQSYFYMSRKQKIQVYQFNINQNTVSSTPILNYQTHTNKNGKLIKIYDENPFINKVVCLPMQTREITDSWLYVMDANNPLGQPVQDINSLNLFSQHFLDALYIDLGNMLLCAVKPDDLTGDDFLVFNIQLDLNNELHFQYSNSLNTNINFPSDSVNFPVNICPFGNGNYLLSKKNELVKVTKSGNRSTNYTFSIFPSQPNSYFERVITIEEGNFSNYYVMKMLGGGFSSIHNLSSSWENTYLGAYVNRGFYNSKNDNVYLYNDGFIFPNKIYIMDPISNTYVPRELDDIVLGDIIYNPFLENQIIISLYKESEGAIRVYDNQLTAFVEYSTGANTSHSANMFIDPEGYLYVTTGMKAGEPLKIKIFNTKNNFEGPDAIDLNASFPTSPDPGIDAPSELTGKFLYNDKNKCVYLFITNSTIPRIRDNKENKQTKIFRINKNGDYSELTAGNNQINELCYDAVLCKDDNIYLCLENSLEKIICSSIFGQDVIAQIFSQYYCIDLEYDPEDNHLFALQRNQNGNQNFQVISIPDNYSILHTIAFNEYINSIRYIEENRIVIAYSPIDESVNLPDENVKAYYINVSSDSYNYTYELLGLKSLSRRDDFNKLNIDIIYDKVRNKVFIPNGNQSNVSIINTIPSWNLDLTPGWNWISFPCLERAGNDAVPSLPLLMSVSPFPEDYLHLKHLIPINQNTIYKNYDNPTWTGILDEVQSTLGYKIETSNDDLTILPLTGTVLDPGTTFDLYGRKFNWTGYFLQRTQSPFDAIGIEFLDKIDQITGQYWSCIKKDPSPTKSTGGGIWYCACQQGRVEIKYGEMVVIGPSEDITNFHWQMAGQTPIEDPKAPSQSFQYLEKPEYDPLFIELDTLDLPEEIGAFAGDSCIGATMVLPSDTMALICAYSQGFEGEEITFEMIYSTKSGRPKCRDYYVMNHFTGIREQRRIIAGEKQPYFLVSLKQSEESILNETFFNLQVMPNPAKDEFIIAYFTSQNSSVEMQLFNALGVQIHSWNCGIQPEGNYSFKISTYGFHSGCYYLMVKAGNIIQMQKILIIH
jgi:hypothetical protein